MPSPALEDREKEINIFLKQLGYKPIDAIIYNQADNKIEINKKYYDEGFGVEYYANENLPNGVSSDEIDKVILKAKYTERFFGFALSRVSLSLLLDLSHDDYSKGISECVSLPLNHTSLNGIIHL